MYLSKKAFITLIVYGIVNPEPKEIRKFSEQLNLLSIKLKDLVNDDYWTLAVIDKDPQRYFYIALPLHVLLMLKTSMNMILILLGEIAKEIIYLKLMKST